MRAAILALGGGLVLSDPGGSAFAAAAWCPDLERVTDVAATGKFAYIAGAPREGSFRDTTVPLTGWRDCSLYGGHTYTCDSQQFKTVADAEKALAQFVDGVTDCLGEEWSKDASRSSPGYVVVRNTRHPISMTLSTDKVDNDEHVVRLNVFLRGR
jgi:hypothetical protein